MSTPCSPDTTWRAVAHLVHPDVASWSFGAAHAARLERQCPDISCTVCSDRESFRAALPGAHIALVWRFSDDDVARATRLWVLATPAAGRDYFRVNLPPGVVTFYGQFHGRLMSETALAMILGMTRGLLPAVTTYAALPWPRREVSPHMRALRGSRATILGFGNIGSAIGRSLKALGVHVTGVKRTVDPDAIPSFFEEDDRLVPVDQLDACLPQTDHLVMALPATPQTDHLMDARRLALLPTHATVTNLGRGNAIEEPALVAALNAGQLAGACLDVFDTEPLPVDSPLRTCPHLWRMPHASAVAPNYLDLFVDDFAEQFRRWKGEQHSG